MAHTVRSVARVVASERVGRQAYDIVRLRYPLFMREDDAAIAELGVCHLVSPIVTRILEGRLPTVRTEVHAIDRPRMEHHFSVVPDEDGNANLDIVVDTTYRQFLRSNVRATQPNVLVMPRQEVVAMIGKMASDAAYADLYLPTTLKR